jgi:hypothetical protein
VRGCSTISGFGVGAGFGGFTGFGAATGGGFGVTSRHVSPGHALSL